MGTIINKVYAKHYEKVYQGAVETIETELQRLYNISASEITPAEKRRIGTLNHALKEAKDPSPYDF